MIEAASDSATGKCRERGDVETVECVSAWAL
jgi:hypothetical protein